MVRAMLASSLQGVVSQTLLKKAEGGGRVGAFEILVGTNAVRNLIRENQIAQMYSMIQTGARYGMITMEDAIKSLMEGGVVDRAEARRALLKTTDEEEDPEDEEAGDMGVQKTAARGPQPARGGAGKADDGEYSF